MKAKGLGTGLSALLGDAAIEDATRDYENVPIQLVEPRKEQPRTLFEKEKIEELADSIRVHGILSPLTVRKIDEGYYQIIAGERRWRAAREAGLIEVPVRIVEADDKKALEIALVENLQREDLSPIEEARGYKALMDEFGLTQEDAAQRVSKSRPAVANALRLLLLPEEIMQLVEGGELFVGSARALLALKDDEKILKAAHMVINKNMSVREVESLVKKFNHEKPDYNDAVGDEIDYIFEAKSRLESALGRRVVIKQSKDAGRIELEYYGQEDFDVLFDKLMKL